MSVEIPAFPGKAEGKGQDGNCLQGLCCHDALRLPADITNTPTFNAGNRVIWDYYEAPSLSGSVFWPGMFAHLSLRRLTLYFSPR